MPCCFAQPTASMIFFRYVSSNVPRDGSNADHDRFSLTTLNPFAAMPAKSSSVSGLVAATPGRGW